MKNKIYLFPLLALLVFLGGCTRPASQPEGPSPISDYQDATYFLDNQAVALKDGLAYETSTKTTTRYFDNEVRGDFNNDGREDIAFLLTQDSGGSGLFYYLTAALASDNGYTGLNAILLGDRIAPQTTEFKAGKIIVNYADRRAAEPMTTAPSVGVSKYFQVVEGRLGEAENPAGLANPASVNCTVVGGRLVIEKRGDGGEYGLCYFEDNRACEEWALLKGDCSVGGVKTTGFDSIDQKYCAWRGGETLAVPQSVCTFKNGSKCSTVEFYEGSCAPTEN